MKHTYFGELSMDINYSDDVIWNKELYLNGWKVEIHVWAEQRQTLDVARLDAFALLLQNLTDVDVRARMHLVDFLKADDKETGYIAYHMENLPDLAPLGISPDAFAQAMQLTHIDLSANTGEVMLDYKIAPGHSGQILCVHLDAQGDFGEVNWES